MRIRVYAKGTDAERFHARCRVVDGHLLWYGGSQFRMGDLWRCTPTQAAYLIMTGKSRLPDGFGACRACDAIGCVAHVRLLRPAEMAAVFGGGRKQRTLTTEDVKLIRSWPDMRHLPPGKPRRDSFDDLMSRVSPGASRNRVKTIRSPSTWSRIYKEATP